MKSHLFIASIGARPRERIARSINNSAWSIKTGTIL